MSGVGDAGLLFSPNQITNLELWFSSNNGTFQDSGFTTPAVLNGDPVQGWKNRVIGGTDMTGSGMTLHTGDINGLPGIGDGSLQGGTNLPAITSPTTMFLVKNITPVSNLTSIHNGVNNAFFFSGDRTVWLDGTRNDGSGGYIFMDACVESAVGTFTMGNWIATGTPGTYNVFTHLFKSGTNASFVKIHNSLASGTAQGDCPDGIHLFNRTNAKFTIGTSAKYAEILLYSKALSSTEESQVYTYLATKYAL